MECAVMKQLCLVAIVLWLTVSGAIGHGLTQNSPKSPHTKGNDAGGIKAMGCFNNTAVCQVGFELLGSQKCYHFSCLADTWDGALETCRRMGATLAYPLNAVEDTILMNYIALRFKGTGEWWLGGSDAATEGQWVWAHDNSPIAYTAWGPGEPSSSGDEDCLNYYEPKDWKWNDSKCTNIIPFVCQQI